MTPEQKRKYNTAMGGILVATGIVAWMASIYYAVVPNPPKPYPIVSAPAVDMASCRSALSQLGYQAAITGQDITAFEEMGADPRAQLEKASLTSLVCKMPMYSFCMGEACGRFGVNIVLRPPSTGVPLSVVKPADQVTP